ncbi:MAG: hypothetical protein JSS30_05300 [Verrucomicrobia bacterium]|nr:hypothetical protein [Verrucomicrobiota bacterium]
MKLLVFFFLVIFITSCTRLPPHQKAGYSTIRGHIKNMAEEHWLTESIGGSFYEGDIKQLEVSFKVISDEFNIDHLRSLMVKGIETFLTSINSDNQVCPYLNHYPFTDKDIEYGVSLTSSEGKWLGFAFLMKGNLIYYKTHPYILIRNAQIEKVLVEPYPEALQKVKAGLESILPQQ